MGLNYTMKLNNEDVNATEIFTDLIKAINIGKHIFLFEQKLSFLLNVSTIFSNDFSL
jgi:hypothetical protein